mgnify:FL=1
MLLSFYAIISGLIFALYSCSKDEDETLYNEVSKDNYPLHSSNDIYYETSDDQIDINNPSERGSVTVGFYFTWDEWGRKKYDCRGAGLCNFRLVTIEIQISLKSENYAIVYADNRNSYYVDLPIDEKIVFENNDKLFYIDEDLYAKAPDGNTYKLPAGIYSLNKSIGKMGGYRLPLQVVKSIN